MNRNHKWLAVFVSTAVAALMGCGGSDSPNTVVTPPPVEAGADNDVAPDGQPEADPPDNTAPDADAAVPETGNDADAGFDAEASQDAEAGIDSDAAEASEDAEAGIEADVNETGSDASPDQDAPPPEVCNGQDDNGNGLKDEGFDCVGGMSGSCWTTCGTQGSITCQIPSCQWSACAPPSENCNNFKDDDCDDKVDCQDPDCSTAPACQCNPPALNTACGYAGEFSCSPAVRCNCNFLWDNASLPHFSCINVETCNGQDDNGNGQADETFPCIQNSIGGCDTTCHTVGTRTCDSSCQQGACVPPTENCFNGVDDDCDGKTDCTDTDCSQFIACQSELCDGVDNNGNGLKDEGFECVYATKAPCPTVCGSQGEKVCSTATCSWGACVPPAEVCGNGKDDDCNGLSECDDPVCKSLPSCTPVTECTAGQTLACTTWCQSQGNKTCSQSGWWGACVPPAEVCGNGKDDDCNGLSECDDPDCAGQTFCQSEVCDGQDNNGNGLADETFQCKLGEQADCPTACGSMGKKTCQGPACMWGACQKPAEDCNNGIDDDCDEAPDCWDTDCAGATACQHNFGTCSAHTPTNQPYSCAVWSQDVMPDGMFLVHDGCANGLNDQWVVGGTYGEGRVRHLTSGNTWTDIQLPVATKMAGGATCQGAADTYVTAVEEYAPYKYNGVLLRWNGSTLVRVAEAQSHDVEFSRIWASSANNVWIYGRTDYGLLDGAYIYVWNGNSMSRRKLPQLYAPMTFHAAKIWGTGSNDVWMAGNTYDPNDRNNYDKYAGAIMHFDGKSWGKVQIANAEKYGFTEIHGSSSCDVMAVGSYRSSPTVMQGLTFQRNGNVWETKTYTNVETVTSVVKTAPFKYVLQGGQPDGAIAHIWMGTDQGNFNLTWSNNFQYFVNGSAFWDGGATWNVPGTNVIMTAGDGTHGYGETTGQGTYAMVFRSTCQ